MKTSLRFALLLWIALAGTALAQTPDCPCPVPPPPPPVWFGMGELSFLSTSGNSSAQTLGGSLELNDKPTPWLFTLKGAYLRSSSEHVLKAETFTGSLRASRDLTEAIDVFVGASYLRNKFAGIDSLFGGEAGAGYKLVRGPVHFLRAEAAVGYAHEKDVLLGVIFPSRNYATGRAGLGYKWQFTKAAAFSNDFSYLLDFSDTANWFITDKAAITAAMSSIFSLQASWTLLYRNEPVPGFSKTDTATAVGIVAKF